MSINKKNDDHCRRRSSDSKSEPTVQAHCGEATAAHPPTRQNDAWQRKKQMTTREHVSESERNEETM